MADFGKLHYLNVGPNGTLAPSGALGTTVADIDALLAHLASDAELKKITLYFHRGLVNETAGLAVAKRIWGLMNGHITPPGFADTVPDGYLHLPSNNYQRYAPLRSILKSRSEADIASAVAYGKSRALGGGWSGAAGNS
jgi:hypothetical protein